jgi:hypothetical protein
MLLDSMVTIRPKIWNSIESYQRPLEDDEVTIGIHARHVDPDDDGSNVTEFVSCLEQMQAVFGSDKRCTVYVASDRPAAILNLERTIQRLNCTSVSVDHEHESHSIGNGATQKEHGPFAGAPFFKDFALLTSQVRSGFIHSGGTVYGSSASALLWQHIVYNGIQDGTNHHPPVDCSPALGQLRFHVN